MDNFGGLICLLDGESGGKNYRGSGERHIEGLDQKLMRDHGGIFNERVMESGFLLRKQITVFAGEDKRR